MKDQISAFVDGELDAQEALWLIERLESDPELLRAWDDYHRVGDALRGHVGPDISAAVAARLVAEPIVLARRGPFASVQGATRWVLPAAASLAAVAFVAWMALPQREPLPAVAQTSPASTPAAATQLAASPTAAALSATGGAREDEQARAQAGAAALSALGVGDYLLAHQRFSPSSAMQGVAPYVRTVSRGGDER